MAALPLGFAQAQAQVPSAAPRSAPTSVTTAVTKTLRYAFEVAETSFDPAKVSDLYSRTLTPHIFEALYHYDPLARPVKIKPLTADGMPQHSDDYRTWTVKVRPGIFFASDPAFNGKRRELVAADYVYTFKRFADPANRSPVWTSMEDQKFVGLKALRDDAVSKKLPFDYAREIDGVKALDRYTVQFKVEEPRPRFIELLAGSDLVGAVAREVVEFYGDQIDAHPVGTGPFRLAAWRRSSFIALERNPEFRDVRYDAEPAADDADGQAWLLRFKGRRLPMVDRVEISIIEEEQPRWLSFVNGQTDLAYHVGFQFVALAMPDGKVAPNLAKLGIRGTRIVEPASNSLFFNMDDPVVGGYTAAKVALRRAVGLAMDVPTLIAYAFSGLGVPAQSPLLPFTSGFDASDRSEFGTYDPARAKALLDLYGWTDRNGDGWRDMPDGSPLVLHLATQSDQRSRRIDELFKRNMDAIGLRAEFKVAQWPENLKAARAGKLPMWSVGSTADGPDGQGSLARYDSRQIGGENMARFKLPEFDAINTQLQALPDGPEREALFQRSKKLALAYMPYKFTLYRQSVDMTQPWLIGYRRPVFWTDWWQYVDIDTALQNGARR